MKIKICLTLPSILLLTIIIRTNTVSAQTSVTFTEQQTDYYFYNGGQIALIGGVLASKSSSIKFDFWLHDLAQDWDVSVTEPSAITIGKNANYTRTLTIPEGTPNGTYTMVTLIYVDDVHEYTTFTYVHINEEALVGLVKDDHYYNDSWIAYENFPRDFYNPNKAGFSFRIGFFCMQPQQQYDAAEVYIGWQVIDEDSNMAIDGTWGMKCWTDIHEIRYLDFYSFLTTRWYRANYTFRVYVQNMTDGTILEDLRVPIQVNCVSLDLLPTETTTLDAIILPNWDINQNFYVNAQDAVILGVAFSSEFGDTNYNPFADINVEGGDGYINAKDATLLGVHFGENYT